ncbi:hypothetical protein Leryth_003817 [Lithospermum erythrorhizon]|uniref:Oxygenase n=1 Tax=Lithospermum erythrorhizon TaxID=34254 RepID=A0AAV3QK61_LITER|nr:hypothetical protein Leryth_003817 [Lithospermum erythrorhizon]
MAEIPQLVTHQSLLVSDQSKPIIKKSVKVLAEIPNLNTIPSNYDYYSNTTNKIPLEEHYYQGSEQEDSVPIIDFSLLTSNDPDQRSKVIQELSRACQDWGFFMLINHGIQEKAMKAAIGACNGFFNMEEEDKLEYEGSHPLHGIRYGTSFNVAKDNVFFWRDFLKLMVHPHFHCPTKPLELSEVLLDYSRRNREVAMELLEGVSESLGLEKNEMQKELELESGYQLFVANYYPPCPEPERAIGMPPHSDHGLLTFLIDNGIGGLEIQHNGKWLPINTTIPNAILVNVGDQLEVFSNGKYKSVLHRAVLNNKVTRLSLGFANGPSLEATLSPATKLIQTTNCVPAYIAIKYKDYLELQQTNQLKEKSCLESLKNQLIN